MTWQIINGRYPWQIKIFEYLIDCKKLKSKEFTNGSNDAHVMKSL